MAENTLEQRFADARHKFSTSTAAIVRDADAPASDVDEIFRLLSESDDILDRVQDEIHRLES